ncbi:hypothetical protein [Scytonema sp. PRP1]|uniref:hypothetical protein n=1 Tax=Scytonema sp. PRP1 TaxID=3120513 RepID=UPI00300C2054
MRKGLEILEQRKATYASNSIPHYKPWVFLISGSTPTDNWQNAARLVAEAATKDNLTFFAVGAQDTNISI